MKIFYKLIFITLVIIHAYFLYQYGISTFITTCIFYYSVYWLLKKIFFLIRNEERRYLILKNIKTILLIMLILEFMLTFVFTFINNYMENDKYMYFSDYKRKKQCELLKSFGFKRARFTFTDAYIPNSSRTIKRNDYNYTHLYNEIGFRGKLPKINKDSNEYRIIILGDSFVEGDGAPEDSTISTLLARKLNTNNSKHKYYVINAGISGSNTVYEQQIYLNKLQQFKPNMIVNVIFSNDLGDINIMENSHRLPISEYLYAISHNFRLLYHGILEFDNFDNAQISNSTKAKRTKIIKIITKNNDSFKKELHKNNIELVNVYLPSTEEIKWKKCFNTLAKSINYEVNLYDEFIELQEIDKHFTKKYYWSGDAHLRPVGYNLVADILEKKINEKYVRTH